jgi:hypothetical protein
VRADARFLKVYAGLLSLAEVEIELVLGERSETTFALEGTGFVGQGYYEDATTGGYLDWQRGASAGMAFALRSAGHHARVVVLRITGLATDTNASSVAAAAAMATWRALSVDPSPEWTSALEDAARRGWKHPDEAPVL